jgi:hypothetical protein
MLNDENLEGAEDHIDEGEFPSEMFDKKNETKVSTPATASL